MKILVDIIKESNLWKNQNFISKAFVKKILTLISNELQVLKIANTIEITILLTSNEKIKILNKNFRHKDKATNVLSFPDRELDSEKLNHKDFEGDVILGDIAFAFEITEEEARRFAITMENHFTHLLVHAILHLLGHKHENEKDADKMQALEIEILNKLDIKTPPIYAKKI